MWACDNGHYDIANLLLQHKADIKLKSKVSKVCQLFVSYVCVLLQLPTYYDITIAFREGGLPCLSPVPATT